MVDNEFFRAICLPDRWSVCGVSVRALSCWHLYALEQLGNAYAFDGIGATEDDAAGLLIICSRNWQDGRAMMVQPGEVLRETRRMFKKLRGYSFEEINNACMDYVKTCKELPEVWHAQSKSSGGKCLGGNHVWHVVTELMSWGNSESSAWDMPYTRARCYFDVRREAQGGCEIMSDRDRALLADAKQQSEKAGVK